MIPKTAQTKFRKILWSLCICYLLAIMWVLPNNISLLTKQWGRYLTPFANQFGLNNAWQFFSPAPAPPMYLAYTVDLGGAMNDDEAVSETYFYPPLGAEGSWVPNYNRKIYAMRFLLLDTRRIENYFVPWVCRQHPKAVSVNVRHVVEPVPAIEVLGVGESYRSWSEKLQTASLDVACPHQIAEVAP